jgi:hypothetical protein
MKMSSKWGMCQGVGHHADKYQDISDPGIVCKRNLNIINVMLQPSTSLPPTATRAALYFAGTITKEEKWD